MNKSRIFTSFTFLILSFPIFIAQVANAQSWESKANLPYGVSQHAAAADPTTGKIYIFAGHGGTNCSGEINTARVYDPSTNVWSNIANYPLSVRGLSAASNSNGDIYVGGGYPTGSNFYKYSPSSNTYTSLALPSSGTLRWKGAMAIVNGYVYYFGGESSSGASYKYNISTNTWTNIANLPTGILFMHMAVADDNGYIWIFGGRSSYGSLSGYGVYKYDPATNTYATMPNSPFSLNEMGAANGGDGYIYAVAGRNSGFNCQGPYYNTFYKLNINTGAWSTISSAPYPVSLGENIMVKSGSYVYSLGGQDGTQSNLNYRYPVCPVTITATSTRICVGASVDLTASTLLDYSWSPGSQTTQSITVSPVSTTTYTVTGTHPTLNCTASASQVITVDPLTVGGTASSNQTIQPGSTPSNISLSGNVGTPQWQVSSDNSTWADITGATATTLTGAQMGALNSTRYYRAKVVSGVCQTQYSNTVTVSTCADPGTLSGTQAICAGSTSQFSSTVTGGTWSTNNSLVASVDASTGLVTALSSGTATISYSVSNGCSVPTRTVTVSGLTSNYDFNTANQLSNYFNRGGASTGITQSTNTGINGTGAVNKPGTDDEIFTSKVGYTNGGVGAVYKFSGYFKNSTCCGYGSLGITTSTGAAHSQTAAPAVGIGVSVHGGGFNYTNNQASTVVLWNQNGLINWSTADMINNTTSPDSWYKIVLYVKALAGSQYEMTLEVYPAQANGSILSAYTTNPATRHVVTVTNTDLASASLLYPYFGFSGNRMSDFDNYQKSLVTAGVLSGTQAICSQGTSQFSTTGDIGGTWSSSNTSVATVSSTGLVTGVAAGTATISYTISGSGSCSSLAATRTVTVTAAPNAGTLSGNNAICVNGATVLTSSGSTGGTWTSSNTNVATLGNVANTTGGATEWCVIYDYDAANSRYRVGIDSREFIGTGITPITVSALKLFDLWDGPVTFSSYDPNSWAEYWVYTNTQFNYAGSAYSAYLRSGNGFYGVRAEFTFAPGAVTGVAAGTATITYTVTGTGGCADATATRTVTVSAPPTTGTLSGTQTVFVGATTTFASTVTGGSWTSSNTSVATVNASTGVVTGVATGTATITYTVAGTGGCSNATATRTVTVYACPTIAALSPSADRVCAGTNFTLTAAGLTGMSSLSSGITFKYSITALADPYVGGTVIATVANANLVSSGSIARTTTSLAAGGTYYIYAVLSTTPDGTGCRPFATTTVVVNPNGQVTLPANSVVCSGTSIAAQTLTTTNSGGTTTYAWTNSATSIGLAASGSTATIPAFTATNTGAAGVTATIAVTPTYTDGGLSCPGTASSYTITVNPVPSLTTVTNRIVCNGSSNTINLTGPVTGTVYDWTNSNTAIGLGASGAGNISFTATNAGPDPISGTVTVTPSYTNQGLTCTGSTSSFTVTVNPNGQVNTVNNQVLCNGSATSAVTFTTTNNGLISTGGTQTASSGTISISVPDASAVGATATIPVTLPTGAVISNMRVTLNLTHTWISDMVINLKAPNGQVLNLFNQHGGAGDNLVNTVVSSTGTTTFASGTPPYTGTFAATAAIGQGPTGNTSNATNFAALYSTPNGNWVLAMRDLWGGDLGILTSWSISFDYAVQGSFGTNMNWTNSLASIGLAATGTGNIPSFTAVNNGSAPVTSTVTVTPVYFNGGTSCAGTPTTFTYTVNPTATVNTVANQTFCAGTPSTVNFSGNATGTVYSWTNTNTAIGLAASGTGNLSFTPTNTGTTPIIATITVTPSYTNAGVTCTGTPRTFTIMVNPVGQVNAVNSQVLCNGSNTTAVNFATVNGGGTIVAGTPVTANSGTIAVTVPDANAAGISSVLPVTLPAGATITGVSVNFTMTHTWVSDMAFNLQAPNGQILNLFNRQGGAGVNFTNTTVSSAGTASFATGAAPFTGTFAADAAIGVGPTAAASAAANFAALFTTGTGNWTLWMRDYAGGDVGTLTNWSITFNYTILQPAVTSYAWTNNTTSIGLAASGSGNVASFAAVNTSAAPVTSTVTVTPTYTNNGTGCAGTPITYTYTVNPTPTVNAVNNQTVCVGSNTTAVTFTGATTGTVYNWTNSNTAIGLAASGTGNISSFAGTNTTAAPITGTITVTPVYTNAGVTCTGTPRTFTITVNPIPTVNPVASFPVCHNNVAAATFSGATTGTVFSWTNSNPAIGLAASGTGNISFTAINTTSAPVTATITVTPSFTNGGTTCVGTPTSFVITVNPLPVVTTGLLPSRICISDTLVRLNGTPIGGSWSGFGISGYNFVPPATAVGTWPITYTYADANGCVNRATTNVPVEACIERDRDLDNGAVILYPNPNSGQFNLRINSTRFNVLGAKVYNSAGQLVYTNQWRSLVFGRVVPVNLNNLAAGIYMVRLYYGDGMDRGADKTYQIVIAR